MSNKDMSNQDINLNFTPYVGLDDDKGPEVLEVFYEGKDYEISYRENTHENERWSFEEVFLNPAKRYMFPTLLETLNFANEYISKRKN